jgi:hypothetical protein
MPPDQFIASGGIFILGCTRSLTKARTEAGSWTNRNTFVNLEKSVFAKVKQFT